MEERIEELPRGSGLTVYGPARVVVESGRVLVAGVDADAGSEVVVRGARAATFLAVESPAKLRVSLGAGGSVAAAPEGSIGVAVEWIKVIDSLGERGCRRIAVIGPVDSGKTTFSLWARNRLKLPLIEADIGQNELALPSFVAATRGGGLAFAVEDLPVSAMWLVGGVSVDDVLPWLLLAASSAARHTGSYVADTDGYVEGRGFLAKLLELEALGVDAVVATDASIAARLRTLKPQLVVEAIPKPPVVRERSRRDRREYRERMYARMFSRYARVKLREASVINMCEVECSETPEGQLCTCDGRSILITNRKCDYCLPRSWARGLLSALNVNKEPLNIPCIVEALDLAKREVVVRVPEAYREAAQEARSITLGGVRLDPDTLREQEKLRDLYYPWNLLRRRRR